MAALAHLGIGLASKKLAPGIPVLLLIAYAWAIDIIWSIFFLTGLENFPRNGTSAVNPYSHGLLMSVIWTLAISAVSGVITKNKKTTMITGAIVFSHWIIDFITHPMGAAFPGDTGLPLMFSGSPVVGLGLYNYELGITIGEYGSFLAGLFIYIITIAKMKKFKLQGSHPNQDNPKF